MKYVALLMLMACGHQVVAPYAVPIHNNAPLVCVGMNYTGKVNEMRGECQMDREVCTVTFFGDDVEDVSNCAPGTI